MPRPESRKSEPDPLSLAERFASMALRSAGKDEGKLTRLLRQFEDSLAGCGQEDCSACEMTQKARDSVLAELKAIQARRPALERDTDTDGVAADVRR